MSQIKQVDTRLILLVAWCRQEGFPEPVAEYPFAHEELGRRWRWDACWPERLIALEFEGLAPAGQPGRHQRTGGFVKDIEKYNAGVLLGWRVVRCTNRMFLAGEMWGTLEKLLRGA